MEAIRKTTEAIDCSLTRKTILLSLKNLFDDDISFLSTYNCPKDLGFMWDNNERIKDIKDRICLGYDGHSGSSLALTLRWLEMVCKK